MKAKNIVFLVVNSIFACIGIAFSFTNIFIEKREVNYSISLGQGLFEIGNSAWATLTKITLIVIILLVLAVLVLYALARVYKKRKLVIALLTCASVLAGLLTFFIVSAHMTCLDKKVFGFGITTEYKFNSSMYVTLVFLYIVAINFLWHSIDNFKSYK